MSSQTDNGLPDLQALSAQAHDALLSKARSSESDAKTKPLGMSWFTWIKLLAFACLLLFMFAHAREARRYVFGVSESTKKLEAYAILKSARAAVEQHHNETGNWPDRVPLAALDALVSMKGTGKDYQLQIDLDGKILVMDQSGRTTGDADD